MALNLSPYEAQALAYGEEISIFQFAIRLHGLSDLFYAAVPTNGQRSAATRAIPPSYLEHFTVRRGIPHICYRHWRLLSLTCMRILTALLLLHLRVKLKRGG